MAKTFIIAEKPSVAADIARALGGFTRHDDYFESDKQVLSSAVGHLLEIGMPEEEEVKRGKWTFAHLPAVPSKFALKPIEKNENRLKTLLKLIKRKDVTALINACDAGREGELIFRYIVQFAKTGKPIKRLWLQSMTPAAIRDGFAQLRSDEQMLPLADAAVCRSEADWLVGINGTRAMTAFNSKSGGFQLTTVGRVQTPTLAILVEREEKIRAFRPRDYWEVIGTFRAAGGEYTGRWFDEKWKRAEDDPDSRAERVWDEARARTIADKCAGKPGTVTGESKPSTQSPPLLYDLTSLQREANGRFGFSARTTLSLAQALYEKHKVLTYPRTDARALPEDYIGTVKATLQELGETNAFGGFAREILKQKWVRPNKRIFDNSKISDHFAIIPTLSRPKHLNEIETKLYDLVVRRFLAVFYPPAEHLLTTRITRVEGEPFKTEGRIIVSPGWLAVYGKEAQGDEASLVPVKPNEKVATERVDVVPLVTKPPPRLNEATLLSAMEGAGKLIEDDDLREAMREKGLGTPATRAAIIEGLIAERYVHREGKELTPTAKAFSLMTLLHGLGVPELFSPELTAEWEFKLAQMEHGKLPRDTFMREIVAMTEHIVGQAKGYESDTIPGDFATLGNRCPKCGIGEVHEKYKKFQCINPKCDFAFWKILGGRQLEPHEADALIKDREIGPLDGFRSKLGRPFSAKLKLNDANEVTFDFGNADSQDDGEAPDFSQRTPLGACPKCDSRVFELGNSYVCEKAVGPGKTCDFRSGRTILQRPIEPAQMQKLLASKKTDLLQFVSARTRRAFSAYLVVQKDGKVGFEFEAKDPNRARGTRGARPSTALRVLGAHPKDKRPVELHSGRYGPYVKHGNVNATVPDRDQVDALTFDDALALLAAKTGKATSGAAARASKAVVRKARGAAKAPVAKTPATKAAGRTTAKAPPVTKAVIRKPAAKKPAPRKRKAGSATATASPVSAMDPPPPSSTGRHYAALDGLRGVAVLLVFCVHAAGNAAFVALGADFERLRFALLAALGERVLFWLYASHHGVFLFFVLSGFLIGRMWWPRPAMRYATFAWRRTLRIYPAFLLAFAGSLVFAYASGTWQPPDLPRLLANLLFLNGAPGLDVVAFNIVTWSLFYEMTFYFVFPALALLALASGARAALWLWVAGIALPVVAAQLGANPLVLCWSLLFEGVAFAMHEPRVRTLAARLPTAAVVLIYFAVTSFALLDALPAVPAILCFGGAAVLVVAKGLAPGNAVSWLLSRASLRALGRISYSFYLVHWMVVVLVARAVATHAQGLGPVGATLAIFGAGFIASATVATALWWIAERPYFVWVRR